MTLEEKINEVSETFARGVVEGIQNNIREKKVTEFGSMNNTGEAANSLGYRIENGRVAIVSNMGGSFNYIWTLETGTEPIGDNYQPSIKKVDKMEEWVIQRGIRKPDISDRSMAFIIARKNGREGSKLYREGGNSGVITDYTNLDYIKENLFEPIRKAVADWMNKEFASI